MNIRDTVGTFKRYRSTYRNWLQVLYRIERGRFPFNGILKESGDSIRVYNGEQASLITLGMEVGYDLENSAITFRYADRQLCISGADLGHGDIRGVFLKEDYKFLLKEGATVIDVGANIGDSTIYFAVNHMNVIAIEPFPINSEYITKNSILNGLSDRITVLNAAIGMDGPTVKVNQVVFPDKGSDLKFSIGGKEIPVLMLKDLVTKYKSRELFLKMDCEGCEYEAISQCSDDALSAFTRIAMEYHHGPDTSMAKK